MTAKRKNKRELRGFPSSLERFHQKHGFPEELEAYKEIVDDPPSLSVRIHPKKYPGTPIGQPVPWSHEAFFLQERPLFERDPLFHAGAYYVQEASSSVIGPLVQELYRGEATPLKVLDLCGAPGGKATHLASSLPEGSLLVANETIGKRVPVLMDQVRKWGEPNVAITQADPEHFAEQLPESFDLILIDAPCSGEGLFRKMPEHRGQWSPSLAEHSAMRQKRIVNDAWESLKEGGQLIYCTCTLNRKENEEVLAPLVSSGCASSRKAERLKLTHWTRSEEEGVIGYRSWPHRTGGEGFFFALLDKKKGDGPRESPLEKRPSKKKKGRDIEASPPLKELLKEPYRWAFVQENEEEMRAYRKELTGAFAQLEGRIPLKWKGTWIADQKGKDLVPAPDLALSTILNAEAYPMIPLEGRDALRFLAREKLSPELFPEGWAGVTYEGVPLGWIKNLGDRVNGHFPKRWRLTGYEGKEAVDLRAPDPIS